MLSLGHILGWEGEDNALAAQALAENLRCKCISYYYYKDLSPCNTNISLTAARRAESLWYSTIDLN